MNPSNEDAEDPFPRGSIPFLTIHQAKGMEFPVVVLGNPRKDKRGPQVVETMVNPYISSKREPLERMFELDKARMFYVALSRPQNLLVLAHYKSQGNTVSEPFKSMLNDEFPRIKDFDVNTLPEVETVASDLPKSYSYTGDYLIYKRCPRNYMIFGKYEFAPSRSQTMFFGSLVHETIEDLHQFLISKRMPEMTPEGIDDQEVEQYIRTAFAENFERLRFESGHALSAEVKQAALNQAIQYWRKLKDIACKVTDTEVRLVLPNQRTPKRRSFNIEGVVDLVREEDKTTMYDLKTHDPDYVRKNLSQYEEQLNIYAYIWQRLRGQDLDETAVISTQFPESLRKAFDSNNSEKIEQELEKWERVGTNEVRSRQCWKDNQRFRESGGSN